MERLKTIPNQKRDIHSSRCNDLKRWVNEEFSFADMVLKGESDTTQIRSMLDKVEGAIMRLAEAGYSDEATKIVKGRYLGFEKKYLA